MNKGQKIGLGINFLGLILFLAWFMLRNRLSTTFSMLFAVFFLGLLVVSVVVMLKATHQQSKDTEV